MIIHEIGEVDKLSLEIARAQCDFGLVFDRFKKCWCNGKIQTFSEAVEHLGEPFDDEELKKIIQCVYEIFTQREEVFGKAIDLCKRYRLIDLEAKEENEQ